MQYTLRRIPEALDRALRALAQREGRSLNETAIAALARALGVDGEASRFRSFEDVRGTWLDDPDFDAALEVLHRVDEAPWR